MDMLEDFNTKMEHFLEQKKAEDRIPKSDEDKNTIKEILSDELNIVHQRIDKLEELLHRALGPCPRCTGSGMIIVPDPILERDAQEPCDTCKGTGKMPLDLADMMEQFKLQAKKEVEMSEELPF